MSIPKKQAVITGKLPSGGGGGGGGTTYTGLPTATADTIVDNNSYTIKVNVLDVPEAVKEELIEEISADVVNEESVSAVLPDALKLSLEAQSDSNSGLTVDENGNIKVNVNDNDLEIVDNKLQIAFDTIDLNG